MEIWTTAMEELYRAVVGKKVVVKTAWDKFAEVIGRDKDGEIIEIKPSYEQIYRAYTRCFIKKYDFYYVGNHRLEEGFNPARACAVFSQFNKEGRQLPLSVCQTGQGYVITVVGSGEILNDNVLPENLRITIKNLAKEIDREYKRNLADVLTEDSHASA